MISEPRDRETAVCSSCGQAIEVSAENVAADNAVLLCDRCYMHALAPDHKPQGLEIFD